LTAREIEGTPWRSLTDAASWPAHAKFDGRIPQLSVAAGRMKGAARAPLCSALRDLE